LIAVEDPSWGEMEAGEGGPKDAGGAVPQNGLQERSLRERDVGKKGLVRTA